ncbi:hypothetical protein NDU88_005429 [Pleurodeles waltl]|uniref:Uncharacterized protein n=1 Tax=Pleurodeles waltl TaxID=8319 RepID=A0AAV7VMS1_PLEWA|nr:hypothetical protein NDU88_005429 [Pleurodeles waltl]
MELTSEQRVAASVAQLVQGACGVSGPRPVRRVFWAARWATALLRALKSMEVVTVRGPAAGAIAGCGPGGRTAPPALLTRVGLLDMQPLAPGECRPCLDMSDGVLWLEPGGLL